MSLYPLEVPLKESEVAWYLDALCGAAGRLAGRWARPPERLHQPEGARGRRGRTQSFPEAPCSPSL